MMCAEMVSCIRRLVIATSESLHVVVLGVELLVPV